METQIILTRYGKLLKQQIQEDKPQMFETEAELDKYCLEKEDKAIEQREDLVNQGMNRTDAQELIWPELMEAVMYQDDQDDQE